MECLILPQRTLSRAIGDPMLLSMVKMGMSQRSDMIDACLSSVVEKEGKVPVSTMLAFPQKAGLKEEDILRTSRCLAIKDMKDLHSAVNLAMQTPGEYTCAALQKAIGKVVFSSLFYNTWEAESLHSFLLSAENPLERIGLLSSLLSTEDDVRKEAFQVLFARQKGGQEASMEPHSERGTAG